MIFFCRISILLITVFSANHLHAASFASLATIEQTKRRVTALYRNYIKFDKELESFRVRQQKHLVPSNYNISLKIAKKTGLILRRVELHVDGNPFYSSSFGEIENIALNLGGREILYFGPLMHGRHSVSFRVLLENSRTKEIFINENTKKVSIEKEKNTYHELLISGPAKLPTVKLIKLGHE